MRMWSENVWILNKYSISNLKLYVCDRLPISVSFLKEQRRIENFVIIKICMLGVQEKEPYYYPLLPHYVKEANSYKQVGNIHGE